jgi:isoquinoline 1-oxidoreductase subunit beta
MSHVNRRELLKTGSALFVGFHLRAAATPQAYSPNAWIRITPNNHIAILTEVPEMGQGPRTSEVMMLAEELDADWTSIRVEQAPVVPAIYRHLATGGSGATRDAWKYMRQAGAEAREALRNAAAQRWSAKPDDCRTEKGTVVHTPSGRRFTYGQLAATAAKLLPPSTRRRSLSKIQLSSV